LHDSPPWSLFVLNPQSLKTISCNRLHNGIIPWPLSRNILQYLIRSSFDLDTSSFRAFSDQTPFCVLMALLHA
jgi:hypothetical protein